MTDRLESTALHHGELIDCRALTLAYEFYQLNYEQMLMLSSDTSTIVLEILGGDFIAKWNINGKAARGGQSSLLSKFAKEKVEDFWCEAFVKSPLVFDSTSFRKQFQYIQNDFSRFRYADPCLSVDYRDYWNKLFPFGRSSNDEIVEKVMDLFNEKGKKNISVYSVPDLQGSFTSHQYTNFVGMYYGSFSVNISAFCLGSRLNEWANLLLKRVTQIAAKYRNLNARVMLEPIYNTHTGNSPYMRYFGGPSGEDGSHADAGCFPREWYPTYNICGVEWGNIVCPLACSHLGEAHFSTADKSGISIEHISDGMLMVKSDKEIEVYDIEDALKIKKLLYPALYPGASHIPLKLLFEKNQPNTFMALFPRSDWAVVPVLEGEIAVVGTDLLFAYL